MRLKVVGILAVVVAVLAGTGWYFASPGLAMSSLRNAALEGDRIELQERVDFPAIRESLKSQAKAAVMAEMADAKEMDGFGALGAMLVIPMIDGMVDAIVTPDGLKVMIERGKLADPDNVKGSEASSDVDWQIERDGFDRFRAKPEAAEGEEVPSLVFVRDGLGWKLADIEIPAGGLGGAE